MSEIRNDGGGFQLPLPPSQRRSRHWFHPTQTRPVGGRRRDECMGLQWEWVVVSMLYFNISCLGGGWWWFRICLGGLCFFT